MKIEHQYHLKTGPEGENQLDNLDRVFGKESRVFLHHIGLRKGMTVLDVGCGIGNLSCWLAEQVGPTGRVVGVDNDEEQIKVATARAQAKGLTNLVFYKKDAHHLEEYNNQFDLTYCRWLLIHVNEPENVIQSMADTVRQRGILACEVGNASSSFYYPDFNPYIKLNHKIAEISRGSGCDPEISMNIFKICKGLNSFSFNAKVSQGILHNPEETRKFTQNFCHLLNSMEDAFVKNNIMTMNEIAEMREQFTLCDIDPNTIIFLTRMTQVWCIKN